MAVLTGPPRTAGARLSAGTGASGAGGRPIGAWAFAGLAVTSFGGPLALAALIAPGVVEDASVSAGLALLAAVALFAVPLAIWLSYSREIASSGGLYAFVEAAAGRRLALAQAAVWIVSYLLYLVYTTVQIAYELLPAVLPGERPYRALLALVIPGVLAAIVVAGRGAALLVVGVLAAGQLALAAALGGVTLAHVSAPLSTFGVRAGAGHVGLAGARTSLLYVCGSLPLFLGGEVRRPRRTIRRGLVGAFAASAGVTLAVVAPLAAVPGVLRTVVPGVTVAQELSGPAFGRVVAVGVAASVGGVMLMEYLALARLVHAVTAGGVRRANLAVGAVIVAAAPLVLIDPAGIYEALLKPSLVALWISQLVVFAVFPRFAVRRGRRAAPAWALGLGASAFALFGLWNTVHGALS